jgi:hypothetical protein
MALKGFAELSFQMRGPVSHVNLHARQFHVSKVLVGVKNGFSAEAMFEMKNSLEMPSGDTQIVDPESMATYLKAAYDESDDGELEILIPQSIQEAVQKGGDVDDEAGMVIRVAYELANPVAGLFFVLPQASSYPNRPPHMYSHNGSGARCWMPCLDTSFDRCRWVLEFEVAADLSVAASGVAPSQPQDILSKDNSHAHASTLNAFGDSNAQPSLTSSTSTMPSHAKDVSLKRFTYVVSEPVCASSIGFAAGKFESVADATIPNKLTFYNLLGRSSLLENTVGFMAQSLEYFEALLHSPLPAKHLKVVFVDDAPTKVHATAGLLLCSTHLLYSQDVIDQAYATRKAISHGLAEQWFPTLVGAEAIKDSWIISGIVGYLAYLNYQKMFGQSEFRSAMLADLNYVLQGTRLSMKRKNPADFAHSMDDFDHEPVEDPAIFVTDTLFTRSMREYGTQSRYPNDPEPVDFSVCESLGDTPFLRDAIISDFDSPLYFSNYITPFDVNTKYYHKRSTLVMLQLERMVGTEIMRQLLELLVRPDENTGKPPHQQLTAAKFFKICKKSVSHKNFQKFPLDWVYQQGLPHLHVGFQYHADSRKTEFVVKQDTALCNVVLNPLTIRVHGARANPGNSLTSSTASLISSTSASTIPTDSRGDDNPDASVEEHQIVLEGAYQTYFTKSKSSNAPSEKQATKKKRRSSAKKSKANEDEDTDEDDDDDEPAGADSSEVRMARARSDLGWIRVDPDLEWIRNLSFRQPEYMWIAQLENDRDVLAQYEGIDGLVRAASSDLACIALNRVLTNPQNFFKVRMRAASALGVLATRFERASQLLRQFYLDNYYDQPERANSASHSASTISTTTTTSVVSTPGIVANGSSAMAVDHNNHHNMTHPSTPATISSAFHDDADEPTLRANDFSDFEGYFVQRAVATAIASIRDVSNCSPEDTFSFLIGLLDSNDNSRNAYSDNYYVASLIHLLSYIRSDNQADYIEMSKQIERYLTKEQMMPCFHNVIAQACLQLRASLQAHGALDIELGSFKRYFTYGNLPSLRALSVRCFFRLAICVAQTESSFDEAFYHIGEILKNDPSVWFKHKAAFAFAAAFDSGVNLDALFQCAKLSHWRTIVYRLINSAVTAYTPRIRLLLLEVFKAIGGEHIATVPKLPPRKLFPTHPLKAAQLAQLTSDSSQAPRKKNAKRAHDQISGFSHSNASSSAQMGSHGDGNSTSERPQRRAAARARFTDTDSALEDALGSGFFATPKATGANQAAAPAEEAKPRRFVFTKVKATAAATPAASAAPPAPAPAPAPALITTLKIVAPVKQPTPPAAAPSVTYKSSVPTPAPAAAAAAAAAAMASVVQPSSNSMMDVTPTALAPTSAISSTSMMVDTALASSETVATPAVVAKLVAPLPAASPTSVSTPSLVAPISSHATDAISPGLSVGTQSSTPASHPVPNTDSTNSPALAAVKRPVFKVTAKKTPPVDSTSTPLSASITPSTVTATPEPLSAPASVPLAAPVAAAVVAPSPAVPKAGPARFVIKRATPVQPATDSSAEEAPAAKRPKLDGE